MDIMSFKEFMLSENVKKYTKVNHGFYMNDNGKVQDLSKLPDSIQATIYPEKEFIDLHIVSLPSGMVIDEGEYHESLESLYDTLRNRSWQGTIDDLKASVSAKYVGGL